MISHRQKLVTYLSVCLGMCAAGILTMIAILWCAAGRSTKQTHHVGARAMSYERAFVEGQLRSCSRSCEQLTALYANTIQKRAVARSMYNDASFASEIGETNRLRLISARLLLAFREAEAKAVSNQLDRAHASWSFWINAYVELCGNSAKQPALVEGMKLGHE